MTKNILLLTALIVAMPLGVVAQDDDLYFVPKKKTERKMQCHEQYTGDYTTTGNPCRDIDEYNRRGQSQDYNHSFATDSLTNDIIDFEPGNGAYDDTTAVAHDSKYYYNADDDFEYTRRMSRFDGFDYYYNPAYFAYRYTSPYWCSWQGYYSPWYDDWAAPWHYGWGSPWYYGGFFAWGWPYYGYWHTPVIYTHYGVPTGTRRHSFGSRTNYNQRSTNANDRRQTVRGFGNRTTIDGRQTSAARGFGNRSATDGSRRYVNSTNNFGNNFGRSFGNHVGFGSGAGSRGGFGSGAGSRGGFGGDAGSRGGFGSRR